MVNPWQTLKRLKPNDNLDFAEILSLRGINTSLEEFMHPTFLHQPVELENMSAAIALLHDHLQKNSKILIVLDTDTDGVTSGTIVYRYLKNFTDNVDYIIGSGKTHGLKQYFLEKLIHYNLIIACDSLSNEYERYEELNQAAVDIILLDHHGAEEYVNTYSHRTITVNAENNSYPNHHLSGAGVAYKFCQAYDLCTDNNFAEQYLDLAATGIIADVSDMSSPENRTLCSLGFKNLTNLGLRTILKGYSFNSTSVIFSIAPLINAANRLGQNETIAKLLITDDEKEVKKIYRSALSLKEQQDEIYNEEIRNFNILNSDGSLEYDKFVVYITNYKEMTGYIAQKLSEQLHKPAIVLYDFGKYYSGSIRSRNLPNFRDWCSIGDISQAQGHPEAAGIKVYDLKHFKHELNEQLTDVPFIKEASYDVELPIETIDYDLAQQALDFSILSGKNCPPITFVIRNLKPNEFTIMKDKHTKFTIGDITFLMWNNTEIPLLYDNVHDSLTVAGTLETSYFRGQKSINFIIQDYHIELYDIFI